MHYPTRGPAGTDGRRGVTDRGDVVQRRNAADRNREADLGSECMPDSVLDCLDTKLPELLEVVLHGFERFGGVALPIRDLACDPERIPSAV